MKKISQHLDDELLLYLDGELDPAAKEKLELALQQDEALQHRLTQLQTMDSFLTGSALASPSKNFTQLVMNKLDQYPAPSSSFSMFNGMLLLAGILLMTGIAAILVSSGVFDQASGALDLNSLEISQHYIQRTLPSIPIDGKLIVNVIIVLNLGLGWLILDRAILKPFFRRRIEMGH
jgi:anti-sigma factor RsiW